MREYNHIDIDRGAGAVPTECEYVATLGDPVSGTTCSMLVAKSHFPQYGRLGSESFEEASYMVVGGSAKKLLVPAAYPKANDLLMRSDLRIVDTFTASIPELVLVAGGDPSVRERDLLYYHPATMSLIDKIIGYDFRLGEQVRSNEIAVQKLLDGAKPDRLGAITNRVVAEYYGYEIQQVLRPAVDMAWLVFEASSASEGRSQS